MRITWLDSWRGWLIFLVVLGHAVGEFYHFSSVDSQEKFNMWYKFIYTFHMPAFFVLSGMTCSNRGLSAYEYFIRKVKRIVVPYLIWGIFSICVYLLLSGMLTPLFSGSTTSAYDGKDSVFAWSPFLSLIHAGGWPQGHGFQFNSVLWFLPVLFVIEMLCYWINSVPHGMFWAVLMALLCIPIWFYTRDWLENSPWGIENAIRYFPFFVSGLFVKGIVGLGSRIENMQKGRKYMVLGAIGVCLAHVGLCIISPDKSIIRHSFGWDVSFMVIAILGILASAMFSMLIDCRFMQYVGRASLGIMVMHKFCLIFLINVIPLGTCICGLPFCFNVIIACVISLLVVILCFIVNSFIRRLAPAIIGE